jgi:hypothetical protein
MHRYTAILFGVLSIASVAPAATAPVAYVYVSTGKGINLYDVASTGKLTLVSGSPFKTTGLMIGSNGKYFVTLGTDYLHSYLIGSNGAIKQQESQINTQLYAGAECGTTAGAVLDHTGQYVYVQLAGAFPGGSGVCDSFQTFKISSTSGSLTFTGGTLFDAGRFASPGTIPAITGSDTYAYNQTPVGDACQQSISAFSRESSGTLNNVSFNEIDPVPLAGPVYFIPNGSIATDPTNHFAVAVIPQTPGPCGTTYSAQLASYTVDSHGDITSTNKGSNMPTPDVSPVVLNMSPSGKLLAVGPGLQVFHFNGAAPITPYSAILTAAPIDEIHWDNANHLYALSNSTGKLYVFTITPTSITQASGSPYTIASPNGLFVVPK